MSKTLRVHNLADELGVSSKDIIAKCAAESIELKNHMAVISLGLAESIREWFSAGVDVTSVETAAPVDLGKVAKPRKRKRKADAEATPEEQELTPVAPAPDAADEVADAVIEVTGESGVAPVSALDGKPEPLTPAAETVAPPLPSVAPSVAPVAGDVSAATPEPQLIELPAPPPEPPALQPAAIVASPEPPAPTPPAPTVVAPTPVQKPRGPIIVQAPPIVPRGPVAPAGPKLVPKPAELRGPRVVRVEAPEPTVAPRPRSTVLPPAARVPVTTTSTSPRRNRRGDRYGAEEEVARSRSKTVKKHSMSAEVVVDERVQEWREQDMLELKERLASVTGHGIRDRRAAEARRQSTTGGPTQTVARKSEVEITVPILLKDFCAAIKVPFAKLLPKLMEQTGSMATVNQAIEGDTAEMLAMEFGAQIRIVRPKTALEELEAEFAQMERKNAVRRPPVVTMLGHVDHGKTSLLDAIRKTSVAAGEAGGITQHIGAYRVDNGDWHVTFLDTPGHKAFTDMRRRGANLTDVVVLVVAADDGVMPQTVEALNHAKAAGVPIVIALNKIDLPNVDINKIYGQFTEHGLTPREWGGETDVVKTAATKGVGISELIEHLSTLSDLLELKADPDIPAVGHVIEAQMREGKGAVTTILVREGTLKIGQTVVCGPGYGRVRSLIDSSGRRLSSAGPGTPVEVSGLDELPSSGDRLYQVDDISRAKRIAEEVRQQRREKTLIQMVKPRGLEDIFKTRDAEEIPVLNIILKADVQGSMDALVAALGEIPKDKVSLRLLHTGIGAISEADVSLAEASEAIVIGFQVVPEDRARAFADEVGVEIRTYRIIYELLDDIKRALEGLLEPETRVVARGRIDVREVFNLSKFGVVAGCYVSSGMVGKSHKLRIVRDGRIVRDNASIASLKRFKNDAKEVAEGLECGIKIAGFDDIKPGDVFEAFEVTEVAQSL